MMKLIKNSDQVFLMKKRSFFFINLFFICVFMVGHKIYAEVPKMEKEALIDLYEKTNGKDWNNVWDLNKPVTSWYGVTVKNDVVVKVNLFHNNLIGVLPSSIGNLINLEELNLAFNRLTGELPEQISSLEKLMVMKLEMNRLKGTLPINIGRMTQLQELTVFNNFLSGAIPNSIGILKSLRILNLSSNNFKGSIPNSIGNLENLEVLGLFENSLEGTMPVELGKLIKLKELVLANNRMEGAIPKELGQLASLEIFQIQNNGFDSFEDINAIKTNSLLVFDFDKEKIKTSPKFKGINAYNTRMADTKFEDGNEK